MRLVQLVKFVASLFYVQINMVWFHECPLTILLIGKTALPNAFGSKTETMRRGIRRLVFP
jgi:hypothetical protein